MVIRVEMSLDILSELCQEESSFPFLDKIEENVMKHVPHFITNCMAVAYLSNIESISTGITRTIWDGQSNQSLSVLVFSQVFSQSHNSITNGQICSFSWWICSFSGQIHSFLGLICSFLLRDYFHPRNYGFVSCLPLTEHVQTLYWACADIIDPVCDRFDGWVWLWLNTNTDRESWDLHTWTILVLQMHNSSVYNLWARVRK